MQVLPDRTLLNLRPGTLTLIPIIDPDFYSILEECATEQQIKSLLRDYQERLGRGKLRITAKNKERLIWGNLKQAADDGIIPASDLYNLLRESEENGAQHIFYFLAPQDCNEEEFWSRFGSELEEELSTTALPKFTKMPDKLHLADFRKSDNGCWTLKYYDRMELKVKDEEFSQDELNPHYKLENRRVVYIVRLNSFRLLEIRIPCWRTIDGKKMMLERVRTALNSLVSIGSLSEWNVYVIATELVKERRSNWLLYRLADINLLNQNGSRSRFVMQEEREVGHSIDPDHEKSLTDLLAQRNLCNQARVTWLRQPDEDDLNSGDYELETELKTVIGGSEHKNEVLVFSKTSGSAIDYVTKKLYQFAPVR